MNLYIVYWEVAMVLKEFYEAYKYN